MNGLLLVLCFAFAAGWSHAIEDWLGDVGNFSTDAFGSSPLLVGLTLVQSAVGKGAVCLDGSAPGYHLHPGFGSGANSWLVNLEGGGWCNSIRSCKFRTTTRRGSSKHMEGQIPFTGIMSNKPEENPDFYNWNRVKVRYCDGASFTGESYDTAAGLYFRGQRIYSAVIDDLLLKGMRSANQALLTGCSAGGLASILHCDEFGALFHAGVRVKCLADAGMFLDATNVAGGHTLGTFFGSIVRLQGSSTNLPRSCTARMDSTSCFFPENVVSGVKTPLFVLNTAYDVWQLQESLAPGEADPHGAWARCRTNHQSCNSEQIQFLQGFRNHMIEAVRAANGVFVNSCFAHCQSERQDTWHASDSPVLGNKRIATAVGDWFFDRAVVKDIDCPYPCDGTCHHLF